MRKVYVDKTENTECFSLLINDCEIVFSGATIYAMPLSDYNEEYKRFADEYDIHFIFDNAVPQIDFYTVPQFDIMATDSEGGYIGTIGNQSDLSSDYSIGYIDKDRNCFLVAQSGKDFLDRVAIWKENKKAYDDIQIFNNKKDAESALEFINIPKLDMDYIKATPEMGDEIMEKKLTVNIE